MPHAPGAVKVRTQFPIKLGQASRTKGKQGQSVFGGGNKSFFICGVCLQYWTDDLRNVKDCHKCSIVMSEEEKQSKKREKEREKKRRQREKRKEKAAVNNEPKLKRVKPSVTQSRTQLQPNDPDVVSDAQRLDQTLQQHNTQEPIILTESNDIQAHDTHPVDRQSEEPVEEVVQTRNVEQLQHFPGLQTIKIFKECDLVIKEFREAQHIPGEYVYVIWKPDKCPAHKENGLDCHIQGNGHVVRLRFYDVTSPMQLWVPKYWCVRHNRHFNVIQSFPALQNNPPNVIVEPDIIVREGE